MKREVVKNKKNRVNVKGFKNKLRCYAFALVIALSMIPTYSFAATAGATLGSKIDSLVTGIAPFTLGVGTILTIINVIALINKKKESQGEAVLTKEIWGIAGGVAVAVLPALYTAFKALLQ